MAKSEQERQFCSRGAERVSDSRKQSRGDSFCSRGAERVPDLQNRSKRDSFALGEQAREPWGRESQIAEIGAIEVPRVREILMNMMYDLDLEILSLYIRI